MSQTSKLLPAIARILRLKRLKRCRTSTGEFESEKCIFITFSECIVVDGEKSERCNLFAQWNNEIMKIKHFLWLFKIGIFFVSCLLLHKHGVSTWVCSSSGSSSNLRRNSTSKVVRKPQMQCLFVSCNIFCVFWLWKWKLQFTTNMLGSFHSCGVAELMSRTFYHSLKTYSVANDCLTTRAKKAWKGRGWRQFGKSRHIPSFGLRC